MRHIKDFVPFLRRKTLYSADGHCDLLGKYGAAINGNNDTSAEIVSVIQQLTG